MNKQDIPKILRDLNKANYGKKIKIRYRKIKNAYSIRFDYFHNGHRQYYTPKIFVMGSKDTLNEDREKLRFSLTLRDQKERELLQKDHDFHLSQPKSKVDFIAYFSSLAKNKKYRTKLSWISALNHLKNFAGDHIRISSVDEKFCNSFRNYLLKKCSPNSARLYFIKFQAALRQTVSDKLITKNPSDAFKIKATETKREFLNEDEIRKIIKTPFKYELTKNGFLFSCFTGLRYSDVKALTFEQIQDGYIYFIVKKTNRPEKLKLNNDALKIIEKQKSLNGKSDKIFDLQSNPTVNRHLSKLSAEAGINKHVIFHTARHTFGTSGLNVGIDLFTLSKLMGHSNTKQVLTYITLFDKRKDEAIDKLPNLMSG